MFRRSSASACLAASLIVASLMAPACADDAGPVGDPRVPTTLAVDSAEVQIGHQLRVLGRRFMAPEEGTTKLLFEGTFFWTDDDGSTVPEKVDELIVTPIYDGEFLDPVEVDGESVAAGAQVMRINRFGPFRVPFGTDGARPGVFKGTVKAMNITHEGETFIDPDGLEVSLEVGQSVAIERLEPVIDVTDGQIVTPGCAGPALRVFAGMPYVMEVKAVGIQPAYWIYEIAGANNKPLVTFTHQATGNSDRIGDPNDATWQAGEYFVFDPISGDAEYSIALITVTAVDAADNHATTRLPIHVVRPVTMHYDGNRELAEYYEPVVVHGPIVGGIGTTVTYAESHTESRQQSVSVSMSRSWSENKGLATSTNWNNGFSQSNTLSATNSQGVSHSETEMAQESWGTTDSSSAAASANVSTSSGTSWGWSASDTASSEDYVQHVDEVYGDVSGSVAVGASAEGSIPGFAKVGGNVTTTVGATAGAKNSLWTGEKAGASSTAGAHADSNESQSASFGSVTTDTTSSSFSGSYALTSQNSTSQQTSETNASTESETWDIGGAETLTAGYSVGESEAWSETWTSTDSDTTLLSFSGKVPNGRCAVIYRQTVRYTRTAHLYNYDLCGVRSLAGEVVYNEWSWSPNIAVGSDCDTSLPESTQPAAQCFHACGQ